MTAVVLGEVGSPTFPSFPTFAAVDVPGELRLIKQVKGRYVRSTVTAIRAWRGLIRPYEDDLSVPPIARVLMADLPVDVHGGYLLVPSGADQLPAFPLGKL